MRVLVTGAAGYIGSILIPALFARSDDVVTLDTYQRSDIALRLVRRSALRASAR